MHIVKRKYIVKSAAILFALLTVITGIFLKNEYTDKEKKASSTASDLALLTSLCASFDDLKEEFEKASSLNTFSDSSKEIYALCMTSRSLIFCYSATMENTAEWLSELGEYAKTPMTDTELNADYSEKITEAANVILNECTSFERNQSINIIENFFSKESSHVLNTKTSADSSDKFQLLENQITAERKDVSEFAKNVLNTPILPGQFKGIYTFPKSVVYSTANSYADIIPSGKLLARMASMIEKNTPSVSSDSTDAEAEAFLKKYAPYADNCRLTFSYKNNDTAYYIFCPVLYTENNQLTLYDETIMLAVNINDRSLSAFDSTAYLKNHNSFEKIISEAPSDNTLPEETNNLEVISKTTAYHNNKYSFEYKISTDNKGIFFYVTSDNKKGIFLTEKEYMKHLGII